LNSPVVNMFTGIKYIISRNGYVLDKTTLKHLSSRGDVMAYENEYSLPIGFMTENSILSYDGLMHSNPFEAQNSLFSKATGIDDKLFTPVEVTHTAHIGMDSEKGVYKRSYGNYRFAVDEKAETHQLNFNFIPENDCVLYAYFWADGVKKVNVLHDNVNIGSYNVTKQQGFTAPIGECSSGVKTTISADISDETVKNGSLRVYVYSMNTELLKEGYARLLIGGVQLDDFSDTSLSGTVNALHDGICYFSIPQENGWTAYVDGEKTETKTVGGAMLAVPVKKGSHIIELFYTPEGMKTGTIISSVSFVIWFLVYIIQRKKKKSHIKEHKICEI
ncbi:MAG: YfhO family protein, partial [Ruminococcus sp.]